MGNMPTGILGSNSQQVDHKSEECQIDQLDPSYKEQIYLQIFPVERYGKNYCHHRSRSPHQIA